MSQYRMGNERVLLIRRNEREKSINPDVKRNSIMIS